MARCVIIGNESLALECARILRNAGHSITAFVMSGPLAARAASEGLSVLPDLPALLAAAPENIDYLFSVTNLQVLPPDLLRLARRAAINFHDGPLPRYSGLNAPVFALLAGETRFGISWHLMTADVDQGGILLQRHFDVAADESALTLNTKCYEAGIESFAELAARLDDLPQAIAAPLDQSTWCARGRRPAAGGMIDWTAPAEEIDRLLRALDHGSYANPVGTAKTLVGSQGVIVTGLELLAARTGSEPGVVVALDDGGVTVATGSRDVRLTRLLTLEGEPLGVRELTTRLGLHAGQMLGRLEPHVPSALARLHDAVGRHEAYWMRRLSELEQPELPFVDRSATGPERPLRLDVDLPNTGSPAEAIAAFGAWLARSGGKYAFDLGVVPASLPAVLAGVEPWFAGTVPLRMEVDPEASFSALAARVSASLAMVERRGTWSLDAPTRARGLKPTPAATFSVVVRLDGEGPAAGADVTLCLTSTGRSSLWYDARRLEVARAADLVRRLESLAAAADATIPLRRLPVMPPEEQHRLLVQWNATDAPWPGDLCMHQLIERQTDATPDATAVAYGDETLSYRELDRRANQLARHLMALGVVPDTVVGLCVERSLDMMVGLLGIQKAGGAYLPLDPRYPAERLAFMLADARTEVVVTDEAARRSLPISAARVVSLDGERNRLARLPDERPAAHVEPKHLAYLIYTSGSTGRPKGVMVEHRNVVSFCAAMDARIGEARGTWLAVTSISFDISVLELFWTLARGFTVVIHREEDRALPVTGATSRVARPIDFSFFYFSSDESEAGVRQKYRLLLEGARFADAHGFAAVWTPERHFHAFGGLYPNPAVTGAAIAAITERVQVRAGSCVLPLHHPARVAEEWAVVDNISQGRVGIAFAAGWHPIDFLLRPESFKDAKATMFREIDTVRRLWRGETVEFPGATGAMAGIHTLPRPVQPELPFWVTTAGNPETFEQAGRAGANLLTHLLGQNLDELAAKIARYREARAAAGHPGRGVVSLMLHTFVGPDEAMVREAVRRPLIEYLRSSVSLVKQFAWSFPAFKRPGGEVQPAEVDLQSLSAEELEALLEHAYERYYETSGLFGTPDGCVAIVDRLKTLDVDDVACLIDFGVPSETVLAHLPYLAEVRERSHRPGRATATSVPDLIRQHGVTHMQCTPSMAGMLLDTEGAREALAGLERLLVGGEALPDELARELATLVGGEVHNMYGPTETTIWSTSARVTHDAPVTIGTPIANTRAYVLDAHRLPLPVGVPGELYIGGAGVVRGYHDRPELTAERFVPDAFGPPGGRLYRTGDLVRWSDAGVLEFLGRVDHQVKIRGHRIELGEIESQLRGLPGVREAVVVARDDIPGDRRLVGYVAGDRRIVSAAGLREQLRSLLPEPMVPAFVVLLDALPLTPNMKVDRKALPAPLEQAQPELASDDDIPHAGREEAIAEVWRDVLQVRTIRRGSNFFDLGGHSLLAVQVHRRLRERFPERALSIADLFRQPTLAGLAALIDGAGVAPAEGKRRVARRPRDAFRISRPATPDGESSREA